MKIICLDSELNFTKSLEKEGHKVYSEDLGYKSGRTQIKTPPNEVDAIFFNLEKPACFDRLKWGPINNKFKCKIEPSPTDTIFKRGDEVIPQYQLIMYNQINSLHSPFVKNDVVKAIKVAGSPLFIFLNSAYMKHVYKGLDFFDIKINYSRTDATTFEINKEFSTLFPLLFKDELSMKLPIRFKMNLESEIKYQGHLDIISDNTGDIFSKIFLHGLGFVWLLPEFMKNNAVAIYILQNFDELRTFLLNTFA